MNLDEMFPSRWLSAKDFAEGETKTLTIRNVEIEVFEKDGEKKSKPILSFREKDMKELVLNKTNAQTIAAMHGDDTDDWLGKKITLYVTEVEGFGKLQPAIRVKSKAPNGNGNAPKVNSTQYWTRAKETNNMPLASEILDRHTQRTNVGDVMDWNGAFEELNKAVAAMQPA